MSGGASMHDPAARGSALADAARADVVTADAALRAVHVEVPRAARYYALGDAAAARAAWVVLHGYGQLAEYFARHFTAHATGRLIVAPEALSRFYVARAGPDGAPARVGATWMTREDRDREIADYVRWLDLALASALGAAGRGAEPGALPLGVLGFSQGAVTACRWLAHRHARGRAPAARLVLWGGALPHDLDLARDGDVLRRTPVTFVVGDGDEFATPAMVAEQEARLTAAGVPYQLVRYSGGHRLHDETLARVLDLARAAA